VVVVSSAVVLLGYYDIEAYLEKACSVKIHEQVPFIRLLFLVVIFFIIPFYYEGVTKSPPMH
jgi:hypothetical protein